MNSASIQLQTLVADYDCCLKMFEWPPQVFSIQLLTHPAWRAGWPSLLLLSGSARNTPHCRPTYPWWAGNRNRLAEGILHGSEGGGEARYRVVPGTREYQWLSQQAGRTLTACIPVLCSLCCRHDLRESVLARTTQSMPDLVVSNAYDKSCVSLYFVT